LSSLSSNNCDARVNAIRALTTAMPNGVNYEITSEDEQSFFTVISEGDKVARSSMFLSFGQSNVTAESLIKETSAEIKYVQNISTSKDNTTRRWITLRSPLEIDFPTLYDLDYASPKGAPGFERFRRDDKNASHFHLNDANVKALLYNRGFDVKSKLEPKIRQVIAVTGKTRRYQLMEEKGRYNFIIKERNNLKITRSRTFTTREETASQVTYLRTYCFL